MAGKSGYGCYAIVCSIFLVIFGFGLGFIIGYFVLNRPNFTKSAEDLPNIQNDRLALGLLENIINKTDFNRVEDDFRKFSKYYLKMDHHVISNFTREKFSSFDANDKIMHTALLPLKNASLKISDWNGNAVFETDFLENDNNIGVTYCPNAMVIKDTVFVNHADNDDFLTLTRSGINVTGKIFVARCGKIHLDNMIKKSEENGAAALLYFADTYERADENMCTSLSVYNVQEENDKNTLLPGTPNIPVQFSSFKDISNIFRVDSRGVWKVRNKFDIQFPVGAPNTEELKKFKTELIINSSLQKSSFFNIIGKIYGNVEPDRYVIIGCHHNYARTSFLDRGTKNLIKISEVFQALVKQGWRPRKTLIFANFGARNYGFLGAQKWLEDNFDNIPLKTALYINVAGCGNGSLKIESSHSVATAVISAMNAINYTYSDIIPSAKPETGNIDERNLTNTFRGYTEVTPFAYYSGIPFVNFGDADACTEYENEENITTFGLCNHAATILALNFIDSEILPIDLRMLAAKLTSQFENLFYFDSLLKNKLYRLNVNLGDLTKSISKFQEEVTVFYNHISKLQHPDPIKTRIINDQLMQVERKFILCKEISYFLFRHTIFSPTTENFVEANEFQDIINLTGGEHGNDRIQIVMKNIVRSIDEATEVIKSVGK